MGKGVRSGRGRRTHRPDSKRQEARVAMCVRLVVFFYQLNTKTLAGYSLNVDHWNVESSLWMAGYRMNNGH